MDSRDVAAAIEWQAEHCRRNDAPATARVLLALLAVMKSDTRCGEIMREWPGLPVEDALPLRIAGGLHSLDLTGRDGRLAAIYSGAVTDQEQIDAIVLAVTRDHDAFLASWFASAPQTNEAGRSAGIMAGLLWLADRLGPRFELNEIGASAGTNTMMDRFSFDLGGVALGPADSPMRVTPLWRGPAPPAREVAIVAIAGCDLSPIDLTDREAALRIKSYAWAESTARLARIDAAIALACRLPPELERADAAEWVERRLARPQDEGVTRVLYHSIVWQYLPAASRERIEQAMTGAGSRAMAARPLAWVQLETNRDTFRHEIRARYWPGGESWTLLGEAHAHGAWIEWHGR